MVGTVDYIAPEVFSKEGYTQTVDWWSLGTILFEMLLGYPPFYGNDPSSTLKHVMQYKKYLKIPKEAQISAEAVDLIKKLITAAEDRLGRNGVDEIKNHPFFKGFDWQAVKISKAPIIPKLSSPEDTCNFEKFEDPIPWTQDAEDNTDKKSRLNKNRDYYWIGYTYKKPQMFDNRKEIDEIFEKLKLKKENECKRMFSEDKLESNYKERGFCNPGNHNSINIMNKESTNSKKVYNFSKKSKESEYTEQSQPQIARFTLDINNKYCYSMTEGDYNTNSSKVNLIEKRVTGSGLSAFQTKFSEKSKVKSPRIRVHKIEPSEVFQRHCGRTSKEFWRQTSNRLNSQQEDYIPACD
jgi:serine/threonine kinase 38